MGCLADTEGWFYFLVGVAFVIITGAACALKIVAAIKTFLLCHIFPPTLKKHGGWAVVTGSTDGIGKAYAAELAARGFNIVLISRTQQRLYATAKEFEDDHGVKTITVQADFGLGEEIYPSIRENLEGLDIDVLVNNVGSLGKQPCEFLELSPQDCVQYLHTNILSALMMSQIVLPEMIKKKHGYVVNISSISSIIPVPMLSLYSAAKAYVTSLSQSLSFEYEDKGITIQTVIPSYVSTKLVTFSDFLQKPCLFVPDAPTYVRSAINTLTVSKVTTGYWTHGLQRVLSELIPQDFYNFASHKIQEFLDSREKQHSE